MNKIRKKHIIIASATAILILVLTWVIWFGITLSKHNIERSRVCVERQSWYEIKINDETVLFFTKTSNDSILVNLSLNRDSTITKKTEEGLWVNSSWLFPSCKGRISTPLSSVKPLKEDAHTLLSTHREYLNNRLRDMKIMADEMDYYLSTHSVQDEGFEMVVACSLETAKESRQYTHLDSLLQNCLNSNSLRIVHKELFRAAYLDENNKLKIDTCVVTNEKSSNGNLILQLESKQTPKSARPVFQISWQSKNTGKTDDFMPKEFILSNIKDYIADNNGIYYGDTDENGLYTGYGRYENFDGSIYEGEWEKGMRDGLGMSVSTDKGVRVGDWKEDVFKGEHMTYTSERIYGIDISRYQHDIGKKKYSIDWKKMRITSFGKRSNVNAQGEIDYPVSFCYIKSTESTSILNKYYSKDYDDARKAGIHVGTYHFFSTKQTGKDQAEWFLKNSKIKEGDFPPVLDVEPSDAQIKAMGGAEKLFGQMRQWFTKVENATGMQPIIYVNQNFVKKYFDLAPDIKEKYYVWIARYSEYKPDVHMHFWQLSSTGRVAGIHGDVDINVFNGYDEKFQEFLRDL